MMESVTMEEIKYRGEVCVVQYNLYDPYCIGWESGAPPDYSSAMCTDTVDTLSARGKVSMWAPTCNTWHQLVLVYTWCATVRWVSSVV